MNGVQEDNKKYLDKINNVLKTQPACVKGYVNYMNKASIKTKFTYMHHIINFIEYVDKEVEELLLDDFSGYISFIEYKENGDIITPSYRITIYSALKKFSKYLYATKRIPEDYMINIERPKFYEKQETIEKRSVGFLTKKEISQYLKTVQDNDVNNYRQVGQKWNLRDQTIIQIFLSTGIRCSALRKLDVNSVNIKESTLIVTDKGDKVKIYNIPENVMETIKEWIKIRKDIIDNDEQALFVSNRKRRMDATCIADVVKKYSKDIKNKNITPHKLRATYGTQLYNETKDVLFVQDCMGHSSPKTTQLYIRDRKEHLKKASDIMSKLI